MKRSFPLLLATLVLASPALAQQGATITGTILCADTDRPAHFAKVLLKPTKAGNPADELLAGIRKASPSNQPPSAEAQRNQRNANRMLNSMSEQMSGGTTDLKGQYTLDSIEPGTYFVHVQMAGYVDPLDEFSAEEITSTDEAVRARVAQKVPMITVVGTEKQHIDLRIERGASIAGRILYDDGSPAAGWSVSAVRKRDVGDEAARLNSNMALLQGMQGGATASTPRTDDLGNFRIAGLDAGEYVLRANFHAGLPGGSGGNLLAAMGGGIDLLVYSGDTFRAANAKTLTLNVGDVRTGADINVSMHSLHSIRGHIVAQSDQHTINGGTVVLTSKDDPSLHLLGPLDDETGAFEFPYLPAGSYTVHASGVADQKNSGTSSKILGMTVPKTESTHNYADAKADVVLNDADIDALTLTAPEAAPGAKTTTPFDF